MTPADAHDRDGASGADRQKRAAGEAALELVESGMTVGLGSGSTAYWATVTLGRRVRTGALQRIRGVPTSHETARLAEEQGIPLVELPPGGVDLAIDGMDEVDARLDAIKGLGGALLREKVVAAAAGAFVLVGDGGKRVARLGERAPVPVEILPFGAARTLAVLGEMGLSPDLRTHGEEPFMTDNGNWIVHCELAPPRSPLEMAAMLEHVPGVLEHGLFLGLASRAYIASERGVETLEPEGRA